MSALLLLSRSAFAAPGQPQDVVPAALAADTIAVGESDISPDGAVCGTLVNKSGHAVRDVQLMVRHRWLWADERHPGKDNPGSSSRITVAEEIPPGGSVPFNHCEAQPLPRRSDGYFKTSVEVIGFTEVGDPPSPALANACGCSASAR